MTNQALRKYVCVPVVADHCTTIFTPAFVCLLHHVLLVTCARSVQWTKRGVRKHPDKKKGWRVFVQCGSDDRHLYIGRFGSVREAALAFNVALEAIHEAGLPTTDVPNVLPDIPVGLREAVTEKVRVANVRKLRLSRKHLQAHTAPNFHAILAGSWCNEGETRCHLIRRER